MGRRTSVHKSNELSKKAEQRELTIKIVIKRDLIENHDGRILNENYDRKKYIHDILKDIKGVVSNLYCAEYCDSINRVGYAHVQEKYDHDFQQYLQNHEEPFKLTEGDKISVMYQLLKALAEIVKNDVFLGDIKLENILIKKRIVQFKLNSQTWKELKFYQKVSMALSEEPV